ncbi:MAG: hypothetical protein FJX76_25470 [Armatimonadetes bacterium]|nr:hypothetical protein [Armatimonadota bacterium]
MLSLASSSALRADLYDGLKKLEKLRLFPRTYYNQDALAEAAMVRWLCFPTELGHAPTEIELVHREQVKQGRIEWLMYLFKFRTDDGWCAGEAGPFRADTLSTQGKFTFSNFRGFDALTHEEHLAGLREALDEFFDLASS